MNNDDTYDEYLFKTGLFAKNFPVKSVPYKDRKAFYELPEDIVEVSDEFSGKVFNTGIMRHGKYYTIDTQALGDEKPKPLKDIIQPESDVDDKYYVADENKINKFEYLRGSKKNRTN